MWDGCDTEPVAGRFDVCDLCHYDYAIDMLIFTGRQFLCKKCIGYAKFFENEKNTTDVPTHKMSSQKYETE